jgi:hypothetical protein
MRETFARSSRVFGGPSAATQYPGRGRRLSRRRFAVLVLVAMAALVVTGSALATIFGYNYLQYGSCCGGARLDGTRAYVSVSSITPDASNCIAFQSIVTSLDSNRQLQAALLRCGTNANVDGTCSLTNNFVKIVERIPATGSPVCYPHGAATLGSSYLLTVDSSAGNGTWTAYISGTPYESQSGYTTSVRIPESGEYTGFSCSGWSGSASFNTWQRYNFPNNVWTTVQSSNQRNDGCWSLGTVSNGNFSVTH